MTENGKVYIATVLLEKNRWEDGDANRPSFLVSEWIDRFREAGFDGMELWEKHATQCSPEELAAIETSNFPVPIFSSYVTMDDDRAADRDKAVALTRQLGANGIKYNVGRDTAARQSYVKNLIAWRSDFGEDVALLCECHGGSIVEEPAQAKEFFDEVDSNRWEIIVHPFIHTDTLREWFKLFGPAVTHAHLQMRDGQKLVRLERRGDIAKEAIHIMLEEGYAGSFTVEFTEGIETPDENMEMLLENATADLEFLKGILS